MSVLGEKKKIFIQTARKPNEKSCWGNELLLKQWRRESKLFRYIRQLLITGKHMAGKSEGGKEEDGR